MVCGPGDGPSEATKATSSSPGPAVLKTGVVRAPLPSTDTALSTAWALDANVTVALASLDPAVGVPPTLAITR